MTTPQNELHRLANRIERLTDMFEADEDGESILDKVSALKDEMVIIMATQDRLEDQMGLIIKLLSKDD